MEIKVQCPICKCYTFAKLQKVKYLMKWFLAINANLAVAKLALQ